ncbi:MAG: alcohol dehydrogenase catalytic domain-containing protein [Planctomycetes bacterium]|nr:alcohol dehydrogenase catalytic domain-containing protein [Planctomycetota bacterium]
MLKTVETLEIMDVPMPKLQPGEALVKVGKCGICGSDIRYFHGENPWGKQTLQKEIPNPPNIILGHELAGIVVDVYHDEDRYLIGKRVGINSFITCGRCHFCRAGQENLCRHTKHLGHGQGWGKREFYPGGMAEYCPAFAGQVYELSDRVTDEQATLLDPIIAALHAVDVAGPRILDVVAVQGAGPIGLLIAQIMKIQGAKTVAIADIADTNLAVAKAVGVDHVVNVADDNRSLLDLVMKVTDGLGARRVFNTVGSSESILESLQMLASMGVLVLMATREKEFVVPSLMISGERAIKTSANALLSDFPKALDLLEMGMLKVDPLVTHRFPLSRAMEAFSVACNKDRHGAVKIILDCQT